LAGAGEKSPDGGLNLFPAGPNQK